MNTGSFAQYSGYQRENTKTLRDIEYDAFSRVTTLLRRASLSENRVEQIQAVSKNSELWTIIAADLANDDNQLPDSLRANLLSLSIFSVKHGHGVLARKLSIEPLVNINMSILKGLRGEATS